ncbi:putative transcription factor interactor and regulator CCHC(Zn) family [Helianthus annuus]|nr:putative transcription factor interactor and regulator CCHC(Zn) family [Helianthus annuus]
MTFISGTSSEEEKEKLFRKQSNKDFLTKKQEEMQTVDQKKEMRTCFQCNTVGHIAKDCSKAIQSKHGVSRKLKEKVIEFESPIDRTKLFKNSKYEIGECSNRFYKRRANSSNQKCVVKKSGDSSGDESDSTKSEEPQVDEKGEKSVPTVDDENFPPLRAENFKKKLVKLKFQTNFILIKRNLMLKRPLTLK